MGKRTKIIIAVLLFIIVLSIIFLIKNSSTKNESKYLTAMVLTVSDDLVMVRDGNNIIYTFDNINDFTLESGDTVVLEYTGVLNKDISNQSINVINYTTSNQSTKAVTNNDIFADFYKMAQTKLETLSLDEKIGQLLLVRVPDTNKIEDLTKYHFGGYLLFAKDFNSKTKQEVVNMIKGFQEASDIPLLIAVDEEGGSVVRVSSNKNLVSAPFKSSQQLYKEGGFSLIKEDTINKSKILQELGINVNLAPVVDVSTDPNDYMYKRTIGLDTTKTSEYAKTVIDASKGSKVSYTLKHFPGYGNNADTHLGATTDTRSYDDILNNDLPPFTAGIKAGAEAILVSHNTVNSIDQNNPASLSSDIHNLLRNKLNFTGVIITDDLSMKAVTDNITGSATVKAILAGNDLLIVTDYVESVNDIKDAINDGTISESVLDNAVLKVLAWKYYKGLMVDKIK